MDIEFRITHLIFLLISLALMIIFYLIKQYIHLKAKKEFHQQKHFRNLSDEEKQLLTQYINNIEQDYRVQQILGTCKTLKSQLDESEYFAINNIVVELPYRFNDHITNDALFEIALIYDLNIVVKVNNIDLAAAYKYYENGVKEQQDWLAGTKRQFTASKHTDITAEQAKADQTLLSENISETNYQILSQREITNNERSFTSPENFKFNKRNKFYLIANCILFFIALMSLLISSAERYMSQTIPYCIVTIIASILLIFSYKKWRKGMIEKVNQIKGYLTHINQEKKQLTISHAVEVTYPQHWENSLPKLNSLIQAEVKITSKELISLNSLSLEQEANTIGKPQYFINILIFMAIGLFIFFMSASTSMQTLKQYGLFQPVQVFDSEQALFKDNIATPQKIMIKKLRAMCNNRDCSSVIITPSTSSFKSRLKIPDWITQYVRQPLIKTSDSRYLSYINITNMDSLFDFIKQDEIANNHYNGYWLKNYFVMMLTSNKEYKQYIVSNNIQSFNDLIKNPQHFDKEFMVNDSNYKYLKDAIEDLANNIVSEKMQQLQYNQGEIYFDVSKQFFLTHHFPKEDIDQYRSQYSSNLSLSIYAFLEQYGELRLENVSGWLTESMQLTGYYKNYKVTITDKLSNLDKTQHDEAVIKMSTFSIILSINIILFLFFIYKLYLKIKRYKNIKKKLTVL